MNHFSAEVLAVNDDVNKTIELFKSRVEPHLGSLIGTTNVATAGTAHGTTAQSNGIIIVSNGANSIIIETEADIGYGRSYQSLLALTSNGENFI